MRTVIYISILLAMFLTVCCQNESVNKPRPLERTSHKEQTPLEQANAIELPTFEHVPELARQIKTENLSYPDTYSQEFRDFNNKVVNALASEEVVTFKSVQSSTLTDEMNKFITKPAMPNKWDEIIASKVRQKKPHLRVFLSTNNNIKAGWSFNFRGDEHLFIIVNTKQIQTKGIEKGLYAAKRVAVYQADGIPPVEYDTAAKQPYGLSFMEWVRRK